MRKHIAIFFFQNTRVEEVYYELLLLSKAEIWRSVLWNFFIWTNIILLLPSIWKRFFLLLIIKIIERGRDLEKYIMNFFHLKKCVVNFYDLKEYIVNFHDWKEYIVNFYYKLLIPNFFNFKKCIVHFFFLLLIQISFFSYYSKLLILIKNSFFLLKFNFLDLYLQFLETYKILLSSLD